MPMITISRIDGPAATFSAELILRITTGLISPVRGKKTPKTEVTIDDPEPIIHTDESIAAVLAKIGNSAPLVKLTAPDGRTIVVNAKRVSDVREPDPFDLEGVPGPVPVKPIEARCQFFVGQYRHMVKETLAEVKHAVAQALAPKS